MGFEALLRLGGEAGEGLVWVALWVAAMKVLDPLLLRERGD